MINSVSLNFKGPAVNHTSVSLTLVRFRENAILEDSNSAYLRSAKDLRLANLQRLEIAVSDRDGPSQIISGLLDILSFTTGNLIGFGTDGHQLEPDGIDNALKMFTTPEICAVVLPAIVESSPPHHLCDQRFDRYSEFRNVWPEHSGLLDLLSLVVFRAEFLRDVLNDLKSRSWRSTVDLTEYLFEQFISHQNPLESRGTVARSEGTALRLERKLGAIEIVDQGIMYTNNGRAQDALEIFDRARLLSPQEPLLEYFRAVALAKLNRYFEAKLCLEEQLRRTPAHEPTKHLHSLLAPVVPSFEQLSYADVSQGTESVLGYMVPGQEEFLFGKVRSLPHDATILEIGCFLGRSTTAMAFGCLGTQRKICVIDTFEGNNGAMGRNADCMDVFRFNLGRFHLNHLVTTFKGYSHSVLQSWKQDAMFDFVFIDGSHEYEDVLRDFELVYPLVKVGGWIAFHDVEPAWTGPWRVWRETAINVLADHQYSSTLACGRKRDDAPLNTARNRPFHFSADWSDYIEGLHPQLRIFSNAMKATMNSEATTEILRHAEQVLSALPDDFKRDLRWMVQRDGRDDGYLHLWNAFAMRGEGRIGLANDELNLAGNVGNPVPSSQMRRFLAYEDLHV